MQYAVLAELDVFSRVLKATPRHWKLFLEVLEQIRVYCNFEKII
jgi:hypothetical protein